MHAACDGAKCRRGPLPCAYVVALLPQVPQVPPTAPSAPLVDLFTGCGDLVFLAEVRSSGRLQRQMAASMNDK